MRLGMGALTVPLPAAASRPAVMSDSDNAELLLRAANLVAVLESTIEIVTKTPKGRRSTIGPLEFSQFGTQFGVPVESVVLP